MNRTRLKRTAVGWCGSFEAMASPCEVQIRDVPRAVADKVLQVVAAEAWRIERRYSRYRDDNIIADLRRSGGAWLAVDAECERLLDYADLCWRLSEGQFDITSGVLRRAWRFDGSDRLPDPAQVEALLPLIGWQRVERRPGQLRLPAGMELDLGGVGKEYAVDRALALARQLTDADLLVNFGGDLATSGSQPWQVGIENLRLQGVADQIPLATGAMATSGDSRRFLLRDGIRYSHVLNPKTGWPVSGAPHSVTVVSGHCTEAGMLATLALLRGAEAESFLREQGVRYWCQGRTSHAHVDH